MRNLVVYSLLLLLLLEDGLAMDGMVTATVTLIMIISGAELLRDSVTYSLVASMKSSSLRSPEPSTV